MTLFPRLVIEYTSGPFAGLREINGVIEEFPPQAEVRGRDGRIFTVTKSQANLRYVLYKEIEKGVEPVAEPTA